MVELRRFLIQKNVELRKFLIQKKKVGYILLNELRVNINLLSMVKRYEVKIGLLAN
jgi:hypothetical protein